MSKMDVVVPTKLTLESKFKFRCHKGIKCFTHCCRNIEILLTPYDIVRLKKRLDMSSEVFLDTYTYMKIDEKSSHPHAILKLTDDNDQVIKELYLAALSRFPTDEEMRIQAEHVGQAPSRSAGMRDVLWSLLNVREFVFIH